MTTGDLPVGEGALLDTERLRLREVPVEEVRAILDGRAVEDAVWAPGYPFDGTIGGAKLVSRMVDAGTYRPAELAIHRRSAELLPKVMADEGLPVQAATRVPGVSDLGYHFWRNQTGHRRRGRSGTRG